MLKIRLQRIGRRNEPHFRVLVAEHTVGVKSNKFVEKVGTVNPKTKEIQLNAERIKYWLSVGAQATPRVHNMLVKASIIKAGTINVLPQKSPVVKEVEEKEEKPAEDAEKATEDTKQDTADTESSEEPKAEEVTEAKEEEAAEEAPTTPETAKGDSDESKEDVAEK